MTREEILAMESGRLLDAEIADKVMGWHTFSPIDTTCDHSFGANGYKRNFAFDPTDDKQKIIPLYSSDISTAWEVLEHLKNKGAEINVGFFEHWDCSIDYPIGCNWRAVAETAPEAICKAALLAVLGEKEA